MVQSKNEFKYTVITFLLSVRRDYKYQTHLNNETIYNLISFELLKLFKNISVELVLISS